MLSWEKNHAEYVRLTDQMFDPTIGLVWSSVRRPGYHTGVSADDVVHEIRGSADYALALLHTGEQERVARANDVLDAIVAHQVTDPSDRHFGIWGYYVEEPPAAMAPADWNWADFVGVRLAQALALHANALRPATRDATREALRRAALAVFRRNVTAHYTNIAVMGAVVCAAAGELLDEPFLVTYARSRLANVKALADEAGGLEEYNSPTYTQVAISETERAALLVRDEEFRTIADELHRLGWTTLAERFHPSTGQLAGPQSRAYSDWINPHLAGWLQRRIGREIVVRPTEGLDQTYPGADLVPPLPCPPDLVDRFVKLPSDPYTVRTRFAIKNSHAPGAGESIGTTWLTADACLGTINLEHAWSQRRVLLGYWRTDEDAAVCLRARALLNGKDLTSAWVRQVQDGPRVLAAWWLTFRGGFTHPYFDKPPGSRFEVEDLRMRLELNGRGARARMLDDARFELVAGDRRTVLHRSSATFSGDAVEWECGESDQGAWVDAVCFRGTSRVIDFHSAALHLAWGVEMQRISDEPASDPLLAARTDQHVQWQWGGLSVAAPTTPTLFDAPTGADSQGAHA